MANPYIPLTKAAIEADMTKNEGLIFMVLAMQTIGYRKATDNLTDKRLAQLTGIRLDHLRPSLESFLQYGLFQRIEHKYYDYQYQLCDEFLDEGAATIIYPPSLPSHSASPETGEALNSSANVPDAGANHPPRSVSFPDAGGHTTENPYLKNQQQEQTETTYNQKQQTEPKKNTIQQQPQSAITISMAGLDRLPDHFVIESTQPVRIEFSAENIGKPTKIKPEAKTARVPNNQAIAEIIPEQTVTEMIAKNDADRIPMSEAVSEPIGELSDLVTKTIADTENNADRELVNESSESSNLVTKTMADTENNADRERVNESSEPSDLVTKTIADSDNDVSTDELSENEEIADAMRVFATETTTVIPPVTTPANKPKPLADLAVSVATSLIQSTTEKSVVIKEEEKKKKPLAIPKVVGEENYNACNRFFDLLTDAQKQDVLTIFFYNLKLGTIRNKARYFIGIAKKAETGKLTVPPEATAKPSTHQGPLSYEQHLVQKEKDKKHEAHLSLWADYTWIQRQAKMLNKSEEDTAAMMGLEEAYALFSKQEAELCVA